MLTQRDMNDLLASAVANPAKCPVAPVYEFRHLVFVSDNCGEFDHNTHHSIHYSDTYLIYFVWFVTNPFYYDKVITLCRN